VALKVTIKGEVFSFDRRYPLAEAIEIEEQLGMSFGKFQDDLSAGYARAYAAFAWVVMHRNGRDVPLADILSGKFDLALDEVIIEEEGEQPPGPPRSPTTSGDGSPPSPPRSGTRRSRSAD
jgi:hypothetical protein